ncbi:MAG TPA: RecX family transcriptional regulator [Pyrinomonadaceae bacterium]|nr:RecX family transcriptional regulator [Pyrinomonadaceae bacterium]
MRRRPTLTPEERKPITDPERARKRTMDRAVRLLAAKPRSVAELRERLLEKGWTNEDIVDAAIAKLREYNYLDDEQYARELALSKLRQKPQGRRRLQQRLSQKKLDRSTLDSAIANAYEVMPEAQLIDAAIEKRMRLKGFPASHDDRKKFTEHLMRQGFDYGLIREKLAELKPDDEIGDE